MKKPLSPKSKSGKTSSDSKPKAKTPPKASAKGDWREQTLARMRALILEAEPKMIEEVKWRKPSSPAGVPVWSHGGIVCTGETYKSVVKLTFAKGASLPDPSRLFNSSLEGNTRRAIDVHEGEQVDARAFKALVKAAVAQNGPPVKEAKPSAKAAAGKKPAKAGVKTGAKAAAKAKPGARAARPSKLQKNEQGVVLLSGGNPQIAKGYGDAPVQAYIAAMPGWKSDVGRRLDAIITRTIPDVYKAVKWNSPLYGLEGEGWFLGIHVFTRYIKVAFFRGASLRPVPPGKSKQKEVRYLDIHEDDPLDEKQFAAWVKQASQLPGEKM